MISILKKIASLYNILHDKNDTEVSVHYRTDKTINLWIVRCESRSETGNDLDLILKTMMNKLIAELESKVKSTEDKAKQYRKALSQLEN